MTTPTAVDPKSYESYERMFLRGDPAAPALAGIRPSEIADKMEAYEKLYADELANFPASGFHSALAKLFGFDHWRKAGLIARMELKELALAHSSLLNNAVARVAQEDLAAQHLVLAGDLNEFHHFLLEHFRNETIEGIDTKQTLFQIAKKLLLKNK